MHKTLVAGRHPALGEFVEVVPAEKIVFTFGWDEANHPIPAGSTLVAISRHPEGTVRLVHSGLPDDAVEDPTKGWRHYVERLAIIAT